MRPTMRFSLIVVCIAWAVISASTGLVGFPVLAQEGTSAAVWLELVNEMRLGEGLDPYARSRLLTNAAQRHADDVAENDFADPDDVHLGSDGSDAQERIEESGYAAWTRDGEQMVVAESVWAGYGTPQEALNALLENPDDRSNFLSDAYRELGIGAATDADGRSIYVINFGARPNVLPIFINDGADSTENREVAIRLTNERVLPDGEGATFMGEVIEIRISNEPSFEELAWQPWAPLVSWLLPDTAGEHTVYVQFRDAAGRTAASADGIFLDKGTPTAGSPTSTPTSQPTNTAVSAGPTSESVIAQPSPTTSAGPPLTSVPSPTASTPGSSVLPSTATPLVVRATPFPTWTPLPSPQPTSTEPGDPDGATLSLPGMGAYDRPLIAVGVLQGVVIILGLLWLTRRGRGM